MTRDSYPIKTTSFLSPLMLREDIPRPVASDYWAGPHGEIVKRALPGVIEYVQHHFSATDHGFWPATTTVGTMIPESWRVDGCPELRFRNPAAAFMTPLHMREVFLDEQNVFARVLGQPTPPGGGRWWTDGFDDTVGHRVALLLRRRRGVRGSAFRRFTHERIGPALVAAGARDVRTYAFLPYSRFTNATPGVAHDNPADRRYYGAGSSAPRTARPSTNCSPRPRSSGWSQSSTESSPRCTHPAWSARYPSSASPTPITSQ
jgi:hypothetical protein